MKSIKIKIKTLLILVLILSCSVAFGGDLYHFTMNIFHEDSIWEVQSNIRYEEKRLNRVLTENSYELINLVAIGDIMTLNSARIRSSDAINILNQFYDFERQYDLYTLYPEYVLDVILTQWFSGHVEITKELIENMIEADLKQDVKDRLMLIKTSVEISEYHLKEAETSLRSVVKYPKIKSTIATFLKEVYHYDGLEDLMIATQESTSFDMYFESLRHYSDLDFSHYTRDQKNRTITGKVTLNNEPLKGAIVYMKTYTGYSSYEGINGENVLVDEDGSYVFNHNINNIESVGLLVPWQRIHNKQISLKWKVDYSEDAIVDFVLNDGVYFDKAYIEDNVFYYKIHDENYKDGQKYSMDIASINPDYSMNRSSFLLEAIEGSIDLVELQKEMQFAFQYSRNEEIININYFMEPFYLSGEYLISASPEADGEYYHVNGIFTDTLSKIISYTGEAQMNNGDILLKERKYDEAMLWYSENPSRHNLNVLVWLNYMGYEVSKTEYNQTLKGRNLDESMKYLLELINLDGTTKHRLSLLADVYREKGDYEKASEIQSNLLESEYDHLLYGFDLIHSGKVERGLEILNTIPMGSVYYKNVEWFYLLIRDKAHLDADTLALVEKVDVPRDFLEISKLVSENNFKEGFEKLSILESSDLKDFYMICFLENFSFKWMDYPYEKSDDLFYQMDQYMTYYLEVVAKMENSDLRSLLKHMKKDNNWF